MASPMEADEGQTRESLLPRTPVTNISDTLLPTTSGWWRRGYPPLGRTLKPTLKTLGQKYDHFVSKL